MSVDRREWTRRGVLAAATAGVLTAAGRAVLPEPLQTPTRRPGPTPGAEPAMRAPLRAEKRRHVVLLVSDEHNPRLMGCAGDPDVSTPTLDRLAAEGLRCTRAYAASPVCAPARVSMLTGLYPAESGVLLNHHVLNTDTPTIAATFKAAGYQTVCIGKTHTNNPGATFGFDVWKGKDSLEFQERLGAARKAEQVLPLPAAEKAVWAGIADKRLRGGPIASDESAQSGVVLDLTREWLAGPRDERPIFLYVSWTEPHWPWLLPQAWYNRYDPASLHLPPVTTPELDPLVADIAKKSGWDRMTEAQHRLARARYLASVSYTDHVVARILELLAGAGMLDDSIVTYTSDHGDMAAERRIWLKGVMYDGAEGVPLLLRAPGLLPAGQTSGALISGADLYPTLAGLAGIADQLPTNLSGQDLSAALMGEDKGPQYRIATLGGRPNNAPPPQMMIRSEQYKLLRYKIGTGPEAEERRFLYDLDADPWETTNLIDQPRLKEVIYAHLDTSKSWLQARTPCPTPLQKVQDLPRGANLEDPELEVDD